MAFVTDNKKCQTFINAAAREALVIRAAVARLKAIRTTFQTVNPSTVGTALQGNTTQLNNSLNAIDTEISKAVWDTLISAVVTSHEGKALD
jgi:hypothetical protein